MGLDMGWKLGWDGRLGGNSKISSHPNLVFPEGVFLKCVLPEFVMAPPEQNMKMSSMMQHTGQNMED